jgi:hypothetical protein
MSLCFELQVRDVYFSETGVCCLMLYLYLYSYLCCYNYSLFSVVNVLVYSVGCGSFGMSVVVCIIRSHGNNYLRSHLVVSSRMLEHWDRHVSKQVLIYAA